MPSWVRPTDVSFDHAAAAAALGEISRSRFGLALAWAAEDQTAWTALGSWQGRAADAFETSHRAREAVVEDIGLRLHMLQVALEHAVDDAIAEQARVDALQVEWDAERQRELDAAEDAAAAADPAPLAVGGGSGHGVR